MGEGNFLLSSQIHFYNISASLLFEHYSFFLCFKNATSLVHNLYFTVLKKCIFLLLSIYLNVGKYFLFN
jgi:hypothetical protein